MKQHAKADESDVSNFQLSAISDGNHGPCNSGLDRQSVIRHLAHALHEMREKQRGTDRVLTTSSASDGSAVPATHEWNKYQDTRYAHRHHSLDNVLHVFHKNWHGIRAAAGSLPGHKLAISDEPLRVDILANIFHEIVAVSPERIVFHGVSENCILLIDILHRRGLGDRAYLVFHGSPAMWHNERERGLAYAAIQLRAARKLAGLHFMKSGTEFPGVDIYSPLLLNMSPLLEPKTADLLRKCARKPVGFLPGWGVLHKNLYVSAIAAASTSCLEEVWFFSSELDLPLDMDKKLRKLAPSTRDDTFILYSSVSVTLNVSIIDCHPMVNLESQAVRTPCLRGPLFLDALDDHEYVKLTMVNNTNSIRDISERISHVVSVDKIEMAEMIEDYQKRCDLVAIDRYCEYLGV